MGRGASSSCTGGRGATYGRRRCGDGLVRRAVGVIESPSLLVALRRGLLVAMLSPREGDDSGLMVIARPRRSWRVQCGREVSYCWANAGELDISDIVQTLSSVRLSVRVNAWDVAAGGGDRLGCDLCRRVGV